MEPPWFPKGPQENQPTLPKLTTTLLAAMSALATADSTATGTMAVENTTSAFEFLFELWERQYLTRFYPAICRRANVEAMPSELGKTPVRVRRHSSVVSTADPRDFACTRTVHDVVVNWYVSWYLQPEYIKVRAMLFHRPHEMTLCHGIFALSLCGAPGPAVHAGEAVDESLGHWLMVARRILSVYISWVQAPPIIGRSGEGNDDLFEPEGGQTEPRTPEKPSNGGVRDSVTSLDVVKALGPDSNVLYAANSAELQSTLSRLLDNVALVFQHTVAPQTPDEDIDTALSACSDALTVFQLTALRQLHFMTGDTLDHFATVYVLFGSSFNTM